MIWTLVLTAIGFTYVSKVKKGTSFAIVFGWWAILTLGATALSAAFAKCGASSRFIGKHLFC